MFCKYLCETMMIGTAWDGGEPHKKIMQIIELKI